MLSIAAFTADLQSANWYRPGLKILCACSGGVDSTVMLHLLQQIPELEIRIIHFNHELRGKASLADLKFVQELGHQYSLPVYHVSENINAYADKHHLSVEEAGSHRRKTVFSEKLKEIDFDLIATGQHLDDQVETILMNLFQGTGVKGLTGIGQYQSQTIRPLLRYSRSQIESFSSTNNLKHRDDESNSDIKYLRNNIRTKLIPFINEGGRAELSHLIQELTDQGVEVNNMLVRAMEHHDNKEDNAISERKISLGMDKLADYFSPIQKAIFDRAFQTISSKSQGLSASHFQALQTLLTEQSIGREVQLPAEVVAFRDRLHISFIIKAAFEWGIVTMEQADKSEFPFFNFGFFELALHSYVSSADYFWYKSPKEMYSFKMTADGDKMQIDASGNTLPVKQILQEAHVAPHLKQFYPVLWLNDEIVWIPGIRTSFSSLIHVGDTLRSEVTQCIKVQFDEGTFE